MNRHPAFREDIVYDDDQSEQRRRPWRRKADDAEVAPDADAGDEGWTEEGKAVRSQAEERVRQELDRRRREGEPLRPETPAHHRDLSCSFWGQAWNRNLMAYSDYETRMPRGRTIFRSGKVMDLRVVCGLITAVVAGTRVWDVRIAVAPVADEIRQLLTERCRGRIGGLVELLLGNLSEEVMREVTCPESGLFPAPGELKFSCPCPDDAGLCRHAAAALYAFGSRLDDQPELLFSLRGMRAQDLVASNPAEAIADLTAPAPMDESRQRALDSMDLSDLFGIDPGQG